MHLRRYVAPPVDLDGLPPTLPTTSFVRYLAAEIWHFGQLAGAYDLNARHVEREVSRIRRDLEDNADPFNVPLAQTRPFLELTRLEPLLDTARLRIADLAVEIALGLGRVFEPSLDLTPLLACADANAVVTFLATLPTADGEADA